MPLENVRIPLAEDPSTAAVDAPRIIIEDARLERQRSAHLGKEVSSCERWLGDDNFLPPKLVYLDQRMAERSPPGVTVHLRLTRFDVVEYCEFRSSGGSSGGGVSTGVTEAPVIGDTVVLRLAGEVNGVPFDLSNRFDYGSQYWWPHLPSSYPYYRRLVRARIEDLIDAALHSVWLAEEAKKPPFVQ